MKSRHLNLTLHLETSREQEAARQAWAMVPESERALMVEFAAEILALAESAAEGRPSAVVVVPAAVGAELARELARKSGR